jgi:tetratricopeptide (TPR) repeat protein
MIDAFGDDAPAKMLEGFADNLNTRQAIERCFDLEQEEFERRYSGYVAKIVANIESGDSTVKKTLPELENSVRENPKDADVLAKLAYAYLQRKQNPQARIYALAAQKIDADHQLAAYILARLYLSIGDVKAAVELLENSLDEESPQENLLGLFAGLMLKAEDFAAAERLYRLGAKTFPRDVKWLKALARVYLQTKENEKLADVLTRLASLDYDNATLRIKLAQLALEADDFDSAVRWATESLHIDVMDGETHALLARALVEQNKPKKAVEEYKLAIQLIGNRPAWRFELADAYVQAKLPDKAKEVLKELLETNPDYPGADVMLESLSKKNDE